MTIGIAGTGRVARALGRHLNAVVIAGRSAEHAQAAALFTGARVVSFEELHCDRLLIAVADRAIEEVAARVPVPRIALHTCGAHGAELLGALARRGASCGAMHPLQTFASAESGFAALLGSAFAVDGDGDALAWATEIAESLDGLVLRVPGRARALYHAAAVLASNDVVATVDAAVQIFVSIGIAEGDARRALGPIARAALENVLANGAEAALTGPVERNDFATVQRHMDALSDASPAIRELYRAAGAQARVIALRRGVGSHV